jgi:hypothetical protein
MRRAIQTRPWCLALGVLALTAACNGQINGSNGTTDITDPAGSAGAGPGPTQPNPDGGPPITNGTGNGGASGTTAMPGQVDLAADIGKNAPSPVVRMLSQRELGNTYEAVLGFRPAAISQLPTDKHDLVYDRVVEAQTVSTLHEDAFTAIADEVADKLLAKDLSAVVPSCAPAAALGTDGAALGASRRPCVASVIDALAPRAFRRALDAETRAALLALYDQAASYRDGARLVLHGIFRSPNFLFLIESGTPVAGRTDVRTLNDDEVAARLSYALCEMPPDADLRAAAAAGKLRTADGVGQQAERLLALPCAKTTIQSFWAQWFRLANLDGLTRDPKKYPEWTPALAAATKAESLRFFDHVTWDLSGSLKDIFTARVSILDQASGSLYGITGLGATPAVTNLPAERRGILTHPSVLALNSVADASSPVRRGLFVLQSVLCKGVPPRPENLVITQPPQNDAITTRDRWAAHSNNPACSYCHRVLDPVGFAFEDFDAIGRHRTIENNNPVDASGGVPSVGIPDKTFSGGAALSDAIAERDELRACFSRQWMRFAMGRMEAAGDAPAITPVLNVARANGSIKQALLALVRSDAFRQRARAASK